MKARDIGRRLQTAMTNLLAPPEALAAALEQEKTKTHGRMLGLTETQVEEVTRAWLDWYRTTPYPVDWKRIRIAQINFVAMKPWEPS